MIPSDHFTRFYNEVFKFLEKQGEEDLQAYWLEISKNQEKHTLELFREKGLQGMYEYWDHIRIEENCDLDLKLEVLDGVHEKLREWDTKGYHIVITTGRKESARESTTKQLQRAGIVYDQLIMGFGGGDRILINDRKPNSDRDTEYAINLERNKGLLDENGI